MPFQRKQKPERVAPTADPRFSRLGNDQLVAAIEAALGRSSEIFRGFTHSEVDTRWVVAELESQLVTAFSAVVALREHLDLADSVT